MHCCLLVVHHGVNVMHAHHQYEKYSFRSLCSLTSLMQYLYILFVVLETIIFPFTLMVYQFCFDVLSYVT